MTKVTQKSITPFHEMVPDFSLYGYTQIWDVSGIRMIKLGPKDKENSLSTKKNSLEMV
jgi:hypothetical protein